MFLKKTLIEKIAKVNNNSKDITRYSRKCDFVTINVVLTITISEEEEDQQDFMFILSL